MGGRALPCRLLVVKVCEAVGAGLDAALDLGGVAIQKLVAVFAGRNAVIPSVTVKVCDALVTLYRASYDDGIVALKIQVTAVHDDELICDRLAGASCHLCYFCHDL